MRKLLKTNERIRNATCCSGLDRRKKTGKYNCVSIIELHNMTFFLCCLDPSHNIPLLVAVAITQQHFIALGQHLVYNESIENWGHGNNFYKHRTKDWRNRILETWPQRFSVWMVISYRYLHLKPARMLQVGLRSCFGLILSKVHPDVYYYKIIRVLVLSNSEEQKS